jgi:hypothetical protein
MRFFLLGIHLAASILKMVGWEKHQRTEPGIKFLLKLSLPMMQLMVSIEHAD